ncbi:ABC transporter ATP-binding protein [Halomarina halobia]|uniref:ABC-type D-xylose/L-arabinose transporter n=1 Tax=Halomarina halobia TaxID=3033386 RepID=A0ABD6AG92_9EURY|nr:sn-glycerol-3-phosphate ABC transporter ATP-binding protein UgpC [Halomarina sp. PSR21]
MGELELDTLRKVFGEGSKDIVAVDDLDITIEDGEFLVLVGPSGCGKSTTLRCIAGLEQVTSGEILLDGRDVTHAKPKERDMAMVFQNYALYPHMTVRQNLGYGLKITTDLSKAEINERVERIATKLEIPDLLNKKPKELSGGQQQRVALGRAIIREPEVFLMDEPLSNLDAKLRTTMRTEIQQLQQDLGVTTIYVTHDQTEAMTMGDRIAILDGGELQQIGTPLECYHEPVNQFVAGFIGSPSMNFVKVDHDDGSLHHDDFVYTLSPELTETIGNEAKALTMGIRPEHIEIASADAQNGIRASVNVVEPMGELSYVYLDIGGQTYTASVDGDTHLTAGDEVTVVFPEEKVHLFDRKTGDTIMNSTRDRQTVAKGHVSS